MSAPVGSLRVAWIDHCAALGGGEIAMATQLAERPGGALVLLAEDGPLVDRLRRHGVETVVLPLPEATRAAGRGSLPRPRHALALLHYVWQLRGELRKQGVQLVHANSFKAGLYGCAAARLARIPSVWHVREGLHAGAMRGINALIVRTSLRLMPHLVIANSSWTRSTTGLPDERCVVIPSPVDLPVEQRQAHAGTVVLLLGRLSPIKGQREFLQAFAMAFAGRPEVRARIVGSALFGEHEYARALEPLATGLGIADQVSFEPFTDDVPGVLATSDVLVQASQVPEGLGQVVIQGMRAGLAVVASSLGGPAEIVTHESDGLLVDPRNLASLADALRRVVDDVAFREQLGERARSSADRFTPQAVWQLTDAAYRRVLRQDS
jgi:glycosyltransferase involved in cell wall biosynthesis